jgi:L-2-hydroxyglutarate oxidase LhgO
MASIIRLEWPKIIQRNLVQESSRLVPLAKNVVKWSRKKPGIRAQLVHLESGKLEQDFVVKSENNSTHILNAVSPGWTSALPFGRWVAEKVIIKLS